jgi:hypothetical protein
LLTEVRMDSPAFIIAAATVIPRGTITFAPSIVT